MAIPTTFLIGVMSVMLLAPPAIAQSPAAARELATVRIAHAVMVGGKPLAEGTYRLVLTDERPTPLAGQSPDAQRGVAFVADGKVVAREIAEVLRDVDMPSIGASARPTRDGVRVEILQGGEFLRISVKREGERYLVHLPMIRE